MCIYQIKRDWATKLHATPLISEKTISLYSGRLGSRPLHFIGIHISKITHICGGLRGRCPLRPLYMQLHYLIILIKAKPLSKFCWGLGLRPNRFPRRGKPTALGAEAASAIGWANAFISDKNQYPNIFCNINWFILSCVRRLFRFSPTSCASRSLL